MNKRSFELSCTLSLKLIELFQSNASLDSGVRYLYLLLKFNYGKS